MIVGILEFAWFFSFGKNLYTLWAGVDRCGFFSFEWSKLGMDWDVWLSFWRAFWGFRAERAWSRGFTFQIIVSTNMWIKPIFNFIFWPIIQKLSNPTPLRTNFLIKIYYLPIFFFCKWEPVDLRVQLILPSFPDLFSCSVLHVLSQNRPTFAVLFDKAD